MANPKSPFIPPYDTRTKFIERDKDAPSDAHQKWFQKVGVAINGSLQFVQMPATLTSPGTPLQFSFDNTGFVVCIAPNVWKKAVWV